MERKEKYYMSQKNIKVNLQFGADTSQAMRSLQQLSTALNGFMTSANKGELPINAELQRAQQSAMQLQAALKSAVNVDTGKFDLSKFSSSLKAMGTDLSTLKANLTSVGPQGQQAFMSLAQAIASAEVPLRRINQSRYYFKKHNKVANIFVGNTRFYQKCQRSL